MVLLDGGNSGSHLLIVWRQCWRDKRIGEGMGHFYNLINKYTGIKKLVKRPLFMVGDI